MGNGQWAMGNGHEGGGFFGARKGRTGLSSGSGAFFFGS
jgi:hypothetical protein